MATKLKNSKYDKTQIATKLKKKKKLNNIKKNYSNRTQNSNSNKTQNSNSDKTRKLKF